MERLTESNPNWINDELWESAREPSCEEIDEVYRRLKHYEDLEEQGRLIELPCKVGDTIYEIKEYRTKCHCNYTFDEYSCEGCYEDYCDSERAYKIVEYKAYNISNITELLRLNKIGKTVFLTKEEAEQALAERNE